MTDEALLQRYVREGSHAAFTELVERHIDLVFAVARRQLGTASAAEDVTQSVFLDLLRDAVRIPRGMPLVAWLHVVTRRRAIDIVRREARRRASEQHAASHEMHTPSLDWRQVEPLLDEAVESLPAADRAAILLRFFENKSLRDVGAALRLSDDAAQKRVSRALEKLRVFFARRGIVATAASLGTTLSAQAFHAAPAGLSASIATAAAIAAPAAGAAVAAAGTSHVLAMTTLQKSLAVAAFVAAGGFGLYEMALAARNANDLATLRADLARADADVRALRAARDDSAARLKEVESQLDERLAATAKPPADLALEQQMHAWLQRMDTLKQMLASRPELNVPELQLLPRETWFEIAGGKSFVTDEEFRLTSSALRSRAEGLVAARLSAALRAYLKAHGDTLPPTLDALLPHIATPFDPDILDRYSLLRSGPLADVPTKERMKIISVKAPADAEFDRIPTIGPSGYGMAGALFTAVSTAVADYMAANGGQRPSAAAQLKPFIRWPLSDAAVQRQLEQFSRHRP